MSAQTVQELSACNSTERGESALADGRRKRDDRSALLTSVALACKQSRELLTEHREASSALHAARRSTPSPQSLVDPLCPRVALSFPHKPCRISHK